MEYRGIDVSEFQGDIDFSRVKADGIEFVIIRVGYGMFLDQKDTRFEENYAGAVDNGLPVGVYLYSYALSVADARREAQVALQWLNRRNLNLPVYYDIENDNQRSLGRETLTNMCAAFCDDIERAGYSAGVYSYDDFFLDYLDYEFLQERYSIWVAQYAEENTYPGRYDIWQYTSTGRVDGIEGNVDRDILYRDIFRDSPDEEREALPNLSSYTGFSIVDALKSVGADSSFDYRRRLYEEVGFRGDYVGSAEQNLALLRRLGATVPSSNNALPNLSSYTGFSIVDALKSVGADSSFDYRRDLYYRAGLEGDYVGSAEQNLALLRRLGAIIPGENSEYYPRPNYRGFSIVDGLKAIGVDSSFENRTRIARANGINDYRGTFWQNVRLLNLLKRGQLKKA